MLTTNRVRILSLALALPLLFACGKESSAPSHATAGKSPTEAITQWAQSLHNNDMSAFSHQWLPDDLRQRTETAFNTQQQALPAADESERTEFAQMVGKLTAPDAEATLYAELEPMLAKLDAEIGSQLPLAVAMGSGFASAAIAENETLSDDEKQHASSALAALTGWASTLPLTNRDKAKAAIAAVTETTRNLNLTDIDTLRTISMDDALVKAGTVAAGSKKILAIYGLDVDKALASVSASEVSRDGDTARVKVSYTLLDKPISFEMDMLQRDGRWYSASGITRAETALAAADTAPATLDEGNAPDAEADEEQAAPAPSN
jgi:hypothetical protein